MNNIDLKEREAEYRLFESMINDNCSFAIAVATMPDDFIIRMHDYLLVQEKIGKNAKTTDLERIKRVKHMSSKLEEIEVVQQDMLNKEEKRRIKVEVSTQKVKKFKPIRKIVDNMRRK